MGENISALPEYNKKAAEQAYLKTKNAAYDIICKKGATYYAIALAVERVVRAILYDENHIFPVSSLLTGQYGLKDVCLSLPAVVGRMGIKKVMEIKLSPDELEKLRRSAKIVRETIESVK